MRNNREMVKMSTLIKDISMGPFGSDIKVECMVDAGVPLLDGSNLVSVRMNDDSLKYVTREKADSLKKALAHPFDIVVTHRGTIGQISYVPNDLRYNEYLISQSQFRITLDRDKVNPIYFTYYFHTKEGQKRLLSFANYVGVPALASATTNFKELDFPLISLSEQDAISKLLLSLEDKLRINKAILSELEGIAKLLYNYWFVQFEFPNEEGKPYKTSGGKMVWNDELRREIPAGWDVGNLYSIADYINGIACQNHRPQKDGQKLPVIKINVMHNGFGSDIEWARADVPEKYVIDNGDILFSWSASLETMIWNMGKGVLNQHIFKVVPKQYNKYYVFQQLSSYVVNFVRMAEARKTTMGHITTDHLNQSRIALPPKVLTELYGEMVKDLYERFLNCSEENRILVSISEFLLPLLMNGQVRVRKIEG